MAAFQQDTQQQYMYFENNNPYQVTGTAILPPTNSPPQQQNNSEVFTAGRKRKFPDNQQHNSTPNKQPRAATPATQPTQQLFCEVCNVQLNSLRQVADHKQGKVHQFNFGSQMKDSTEHLTSNSELGLSPTPTLPKANTIPLDGVECVTCNRMFNSKIQAEQHYNGQSHKRKLHVTMEQTGEKNKAELISATVEESGAGTFAQEQPVETLSVETTTSEIAAPSENMESNELYCDFCCTRLNSESQMSTHLKGTKHKNAVSRAALLPEYDDVKDPPLMFYCDDCNMNLNSQSQLVQHLNSAKHMNRVQRQPMDRQFRGRGRGQARGRGAFRGRQNNRGRGGAVFSTPPEITPSFV